MNTKRKGLEIASRINVAQPLLSIYQSLGGNLPGSSEVQFDDDIREFTLDEKNRRGYVFFPLIPAYSSVCLRVSILAHAFRVKGYEPILLYDDNDLPGRLNGTIEDNHTRSKVELRRRAKEWYTEQPGLKTVAIGELLDFNFQRQQITEKDSNELRAYRHGGIDIGGYAAASTRKYLKQYSLDLSDKEVRSRYEDFVQSGVLIADATREILNRYDIEFAVVTEVTYIQGGIPLEICDENDVNVYTMGNGNHQGKLKIGRASNRCVRQHFSGESITSQAVETELTESQREEIQKLMRQRESGDVTRVHYTSKTENSVDVPQDRIVGVFLHLPWDAALEPDRAIYDSFYGWLGDTIETGIKMTDTHFVIKPHPAESIFGTNESAVDWIEKNYPQLPDNFTVLSPDTDVNTYELIRDLDAGAVYASTVGLEMAFNGRPVVVGGYPPYRGFGVTHDPKSQSEYRSILRKIDSIECDEEMQSRAERFAYFYFFCKDIDFPYLGEWQSESDGQIQIRHEEIASDKSVYTAIIEQILNCEEVIQPNCMGLK